MKDITGREVEEGNIVLFTTAERRSSIRIGVVAEIKGTQVKVSSERWRRGPYPSVGWSRLCSPSLFILDEAPTGKEAVVDLCIKQIEDD